MRYYILGFLFLYLFSPHNLMGQLSDDSLKRICISFEDSFSNNARRSGYSTEKSAKEIFPHYFSIVKFFCVTVSAVSHLKDGDFLVGHPHFEYYTLDIYTGKIADLKNVKKYNDQFDKGTKITILDKCYFYLLLNAYERYGLSSPYDYKMKFRKHSAFLHSSDHSSFYLWENGYPETIPFYRDYLNKSTKYTMYIGAQKKIGNETIVNIYEFRFDKKKQLIEFKLVVEKKVE